MENITEETLNSPEKPLLKSQLEMTDKDHKDINSTPDDIQLENPGKTKADLMTDEEILVYLDDLDDASYSGKFAKMYQEELDRSIEYLESIGRLPEKFKKPL